MRTLLFLFALLFSAPAFSADLPYRDGDFLCTPQEDARRYVADFGIDLKSFGGLDLCDPRADTKKLFNDLFLIENTSFAPDASHNLIRGFVPYGNYYSWMKSQTRGMERGNDVPFATAYNSGGYFTMQDGWAALSTLGRVGVVIHEARHTEGFRHYSCHHGPYANSSSSACDTSYAQGGSHAVEMEYYARVVLDSKNLHPVYKSMARLMAVGRSNFVFNESPIRKREALLALADNRLLLSDGRSLLGREIPEGNAGSVLKRTSAGASLVKGESAVALDLYGFSSNGASLFDDYSYFKLFKTPRPDGPRKALAIEEIDLGNLRYFAVLGEEGKVYSYDFPNGGWFAPSAPVAGASTFVTRAPDGSVGLFVVKSDGSILPFDLNTRRYGAPLRDRWSSDIRAYAMNGDRLVKLTSRGQILDTGTGSPVPGFEKQQVTDLVNVPLYDAFEVVP